MLIAELTAKPMDQRTASLGVISAIRSATAKQNPPDARLMKAYADRLSRCADPQNIWIGEDLHSLETGELYNGNGRLWNCSAKLCPHCLAKQARRNRNNLKKAIDAQRLFVGEDYYFLTLTQPNPSLDLLSSRSIINEAWRLFRKRRYIKKQITGYAKSEEFTVTSKGIHYHVHCHLRSKYLRFQFIRQLWTECLIQAFATAGLSFFANTKDGLALVKIKKITDQKKAIHEVAKYITKADSWEKIPPSDLLEIIRIERFPRMFELGGSYRLDGIEKTILDTECISDAECEPPPISWRNYLQTQTPLEYETRFSNDLEATRKKRLIALRRKFPYAIIKTLSQLEPTYLLDSKDATGTPKNREEIHANKMAELSDSFHNDYKPNSLFDFHVLI